MHQIGALDIVAGCLQRPCAPGNVQRVLQGVMPHHTAPAGPPTPAHGCRLNAEWKLGQADLDLISRGKEPLLTGLAG